jgi:hypothetical protein
VNKSMMTLAEIHCDEGGLNCLKIVYNGGAESYYMKRGTVRSTQNATQTTTQEPLHAQKDKPNDNIEFLQPHSVV